MRVNVRAVVVTVAASSFLVAGCTTVNVSNPPVNPSASSSIPTEGGGGAMMDGDAYMSDVMFAQMMIPHHRQAIEIAELAPARGASQDILDLALKISAAQGPEIEQMQVMLDRWGAPSMMDDHSGHGGMAMVGMVSDEDMDALRQASGADFERLFLELMIAHHEGAIAMTEDPLANGGDPEMRALLLAIVAAQTAEIDTMKAMLEGR